jgi:hypothetical protein
MLDVLKEMLTSKKFLAAVAGVLVAAAARIGLDLPVEDVAAVLAPIIAYIVGQGWADAGKEAIKMERKNGG